MKGKGCVRLSLQTACAEYTYVHVVLRMYVYQHYAECHHDTYVIMHVFKEFDNCFSMYFVVKWDD